MPVGKISTVINVSDIGQSFEWFEKLGWQRSFSWNGGGMVGEGKNAATENEHGPADFGGVCWGNVTLFFCKDGQGPRGTRLPARPGEPETDGVWMSWWVSSKPEVDEIHAKAVNHAMVVTHPPTNEPWGVREFHLRHPDGHVFRVSCGLD